MKKGLNILLALGFLLIPFTAAQALSSEIHVTKDGAAVISSAKVMQIAGSSFFTRLYWGDAFIRLVIRTDSKTKFLRATNEQTSIAEIKEGDILDISGVLGGGDSLNILASMVKNSSVEKGQAIFSGKVTGIDLAMRQFTLESKERGLITVSATTTTQFIKGSRTLDLEHLKIGDTITKTSGDYDFKTKTLVAQLVVTYIDKSLFVPQLFVGTLAEAPGTLGATSIKVTVGKTVYVINITSKTLILNTARQSIGLNRFVAGDSIRLYGTMREIDEPVIDVEVVRNISL